MGTLSNIYSNKTEKMLREEVDLENDDKYCN